MKSKIYYGWYIIAACLVLIILDGMLLYSFGIFQPYINDDFGLSRAVGSSIFSLRSLVLAFSLTISGKLVDKYDPRAIIFIGGVIAALGIFLTGLATKTWELYLYYGFLVGLGDGVLYITCVTVISRWFVKKRALAIGIVTAGVPISGLITNPLTAWLIGAFGSKNALLALSLIIVIALLTSFVLRGYPQEKNLRAYGDDINEEDNKKLRESDWKSREAITTPTFGYMYLMYFLGFTTFLIVVIHLFNFAIDQGISPLVASGAPAAIGVGSILGRIVLSGLLTEVIDNRRVLFICYFTQGCSILILLFIRETWAFYLFGLLFGFFYSGWVPIFPILLGKFFGLSALGAIYGVFGTSYSIAAISGPWLAGYTFDVFGSYKIPFIIAIIFCMLAAIMSFFIKTPIKKSNIVTA